MRYNDPNFGDSATVWDVSGRYQLPGDLFIQALVGTAFSLADGRGAYEEAQRGGGEHSRRKFARSLTSR